MPIPIYLSLGSNLGDRERYLHDAIKYLPSVGVAVVRVSPLYETEPVGLRHQPWFLNCVVEGGTDLSSERLMEQLLHLEKILGRQREGIPVMGPRTLDIDLIFYGDSRIATPELTVPHPRYRQRRFVLAGLAELAPGLKDPETGRSMAQILAQVNDSSQVKRLDPSGWPPPLP